METQAVGWVALAASIIGLAKQIWDNKQLRRWICTKNPCPDRQTGEPPPSV